MQMQKAPEQMTLMSIDQATSAFCELAYDFHNHMIRQRTNELTPQEWLEAFRAWLPSGFQFARTHQQRIEWLDEAERAGR
jgi:hypothetical protein